MNIGLDTGFGHTKIAIRHNGNIISEKFPSVVSLAADVDISARTKNDNTYLFENNLYYVGKQALQRPKHTIKDIVTYEALEKYAPLLVAHSLDVLKSKLDREILPSEIDMLTCGLAITHKKNSADFKSRISNFNINNTLFDLKVNVIPQGVGAVIALKHFQKERELENYLTVDIGFNTLDIVFVYNKEIQKTMLNQGHSFEQKGVIKMANLMVKSIKDRFGKDITIKEALQIITTERFTIRGEEYDLTQTTNELKANYTNEIMEFMEENYSNELDKLEAINFVGGGGYFIDKSYAKNIKTYTSSEFFNAIGNLISME